MSESKVKGAAIVLPPYCCAFGYGTEALSVVLRQSPSSPFFLYSSGR